MRNGEGRGMEGHFGGMSFAEDSGELTGPGGRVRLAPQPARLLALLLSSHGVVVSRDDVADHLWPHGSVEVDQGIGYAVREVRKGIEAAGGDPAILETIPRRGFRIGRTGDVQSPPTDGPHNAAPSRRPGSRLAVGIVVALIAILGLTRPFLREGPPPVVAIVQHASPEDGISPALAAQLGRALTTDAFREFEGTAGIVGPTGTAGFEGPEDPAIARETGACLVLSGSLRAAGDTGVIVFTQLVRTSDGVHLWASMDTVDLAEETIPGILEGMAGTVGQC